ncbi:MAG: PmeII family type II restriction endonuclease [Pseudohongiellaceae bacterium]
MSTIKLAEAYVHSNISTFHKKRIERLKSLKLNAILKRKNPYLFRAKNISTAQELVDNFLDAHLSSQEETLFGNFLEGLAIHLNGEIYGGKKSTAEGIDLEFEKDSIRHIVSIKSGPNWGNSSQIQRMRDNFIRARKIVQTSNSGIHLQAVNGCCYGKDDNPDKGDYTKLCGQRFWEFITGDKSIYKDIIEPLGHEAKARNEEFSSQRDNILNKFTATFIEQFCRNDGSIDWPRLIEFNSAARGE